MGGTGAQRAGSKAMPGPSITHGIEFVHTQDFVAGGTADY